MIAEMRKIGLIGRIDPEGSMLDGQTVKTRTIWRMLCERYGAENVVTVDTLNYKREPLRVLREYRNCMRKCDDVVVLLSHNGRRLFFPFLRQQAQHHDKRVYHNLIGGWLARDVRREPWLAEQLRSFEVNWVESQDLVDQLAELGIPNCEFLPNFKQISPLNPFELVAPTAPPRRLCTFSRVMEQKGILDAVEAVRILCARDGKNAWTLDIYGPVDPGFQRTLDEALAAAPHARYCGSVSPERSVETLRDYWALLFPTKWKPEGFPGTIIDALAAGVPVVASRWRYYNEMLQDGATGTSYEFGGDAEKLVIALDKLVTREDDIMAMKRTCLERARAYSADKLFGQIAQRIESGWTSCSGEYKI